MNLLSALQSIVENLSPRGRGGREVVTLVRYLPRSGRRGRLYVAGDLHGAYDTLMRALEAINFNPSLDRLLFTGDLHDRGGDSAACLELLRQSWVASVLGNHELMLLCSLGSDGSLNRGRGSMYAGWMANGGEWVHRFPARERGEWRQRLLERVPLYWLVERRDGRKVLVCHAETDPLLLPDVLGLKELRLDLASLHASPTLWERRTLSVALDKSFSPQRKRQLLVPLNGLLCTLHGHSRLELASWVNNRLFVDTGAVFGDLLTLADVDELLPGRPGGVRAWDIASNKLMDYAARTLFF